MTDSYTVLAPFYDRVMSHVDYFEWATYVKRVWKRYGVHPENLLELGAGTCRLKTDAAWPPDLNVVCSDLSPGMLRQAKDGTLPRVACDMRVLPFGTSFDMVLMLYDSFNYLLEEDDVLQFFTEVRRVLKPGGHLLFDMTTLYNSRRHFAEDTQYDEEDGVEWIRETWFEEEEYLQHNRFTFFSSDGQGCYRRSRESHVQRIYVLEEVREFVRLAGFRETGIHSGFGFRFPGERSTRVHLFLESP